MGQGSWHQGWLCTSVPKCRVSLWGQGPQTGRGFLLVRLTCPGNYGHRRGPEQALGAPDLPSPVQRPVQQEMTPEKTQRGHVGSGRAVGGSGEQGPQNRGSSPHCPGLGVGVRRSGEAKAPPTCSVSISELTHFYLLPLQKSSTFIVEENKTKCKNEHPHF